MVRGLVTVMANNDDLVISHPRWLIKPVICMSVRVSVHAMSAFSKLRLRDQWADDSETWHVYSSRWNFEIQPMLCTGPTQI